MMFKKDGFLPGFSCSVHVNVLTVWDTSIGFNKLANMFLCFQGEIGVWQILTRFFFADQCWWAGLGALVMVMSREMLKRLPESMYPLWEEMFGGENKANPSISSRFGTVEERRMEERRTEDWRMEGRLEGDIFRHLGCILKEFDLCITSYLFPSEKGSHGWPLKCSWSLGGT